MTLFRRWRGTQPDAPDTTPLAAYSTYQPPTGQTAWYAPVLLNPTSILELATQPTTLRQVMEILQRLEPDDYVTYLLAYYAAGLERFGDAWRYADITTMLAAAALLLKPHDYLEIGVRRGRSMAVVAALAPAVRLVGFDLWMANYAGMDNPGPDFVQSELSGVGWRGQSDFISGDSHATLPAYFRQHPDAYFDLITVDGDHSDEGAAQDLRDVLLRLRRGGVLVFDDIAHPAHPNLRQIWRDVVASDARFACREFDELGYGVAVAVRR